MRTVNALTFYINDQGNLCAVESGTGTTWVSGGGGPPSGGGGGNAVQKSGDTMSGPLVIGTATQPELQLADGAGGTQTLSLNNNGLTLQDTSVGNNIVMNLATIYLQGSGGATGNKSTLGVNGLSLGHKSWSQGNAPVTLYQSNQGELWVQNQGSSGNRRLTDIQNNHSVFLSTDVGQRLSYGSDGAPLLAQGAVFSEISNDAGTAVNSLTINADGDLILTQTTGPNAGKSVNLSYGKWA